VAPHPISDDKQLQIFGADEAVFVDRPDRADLAEPERFDTHEVDRIVSSPGQTHNTSLVERTKDEIHEIN
jgi:hypothetical protein